MTTIGPRKAAIYVLALILVVGAGWFGARAVDPRVTEDDIHGMREAAARQAGEDFLKTYVEGDGRVVRRDEGGDVVSEGQAYGMLIAVAVDDEHRFRAIWDWTKANLRRPDGLMSWRWADGQVADANSAADADLDAARALVLAGQRFHAPELGDDGKKLGADILTAETVPVGTQTPPPGDLAGGVRLPPGPVAGGPRFRSGRIADRDADAPGRSAGYRGRRDAAPLPPRGRHRR